MTALADRLAEVTERIRAAAAGRENVRLIAVSKTKPIELLLEAHRAGQRLFGENRVQEARDKRPLLPQDSEIHLIGPLQKNKAKNCPSVFSMVHTLHRLDVAEELSKRSLAEGVRMEVLLQMNLTGEESKSGIQGFDELSRLADQILELPGLKLRGLMTIGDPGHSELETRKTFSDLRELLEKEAQRLNLKDQFNELSMGMSGDYEWAIEEGATLVRVGSAIFGGR